MEEAGGWGGCDGTVGGESAEVGGWRERLRSVVDARGDSEWPDAETERGDDAVVEDVAYVGLGGEEAKSGCVVLGCGGLDGCDAEVLIALCEAVAGGDEVGLGVAGNGCVAIEDEIAMGSYAGGINLCHGGGGQRGRKSAASREILRQNRRVRTAWESGFGKANLLSTDTAAPRYCAEV